MRTAMIGSRQQRMHPRPLRFQGRAPLLVFPRIRSRLRTAASTISNERKVFCAVWL